MTHKQIRVILHRVRTPENVSYLAATMLVSASLGGRVIVLGLMIS